MLVAAGRTDQLEDITVLLEAIPSGQRFRLLHGSLLRARAHLDGDPVGGLTAAVAVLDSAGLDYWAARVRVELAAALCGAGETGAAELLDAAEPVLTSAGATRPLRELEAVRASLRLLAPAT
jgi:hypothetical protein